MAKLILDYHDGKNIYNDGSVEEQLLEYYKDNKSLDLYQDNIFYLTTDIRTNILNWYPFQKTDEVLEIGCGCGTLSGMLCEKCKEVISVEGSKRRAEITYFRHKDKKNLQIYAGNFNDMSFNKKFDYVILIGVFEYAKLFFTTENPFDDFLIKIKSMLKSDGKVLLAIENRYGIKYWAGANEDHLLMPYVGLEGYDSYSVQTFGKIEFIDMIKKHGFCKNKFYYPFPDYKLPTIVYTDERLPKYNEIFNIPIYPYGNKINFNINRVLSGILDNNNFGFFSNSFLVEFGMEQAELSDIIYARNLSYRNANFKTVTIENDKHEIFKVGTNKKSESHLSQLQKIHMKLRKDGINACQIEKRNPFYHIERVEGYNVAEYIGLLAKQKKWNEIWFEIEKIIDFYKNISVKKKFSKPIINDILRVYRKETYILKWSLLDGNASNIIRDTNGNYILIDQEWLDERELPMEYLIYYSFIYIWSACESLSEKYPLSDILEKYKITQNKIKLFDKIETFYFIEEQQVIDIYTKKILDNCSQTFNDTNSIGLGVVYYDIGDDFNEEHKVISKYRVNMQNEYQIEFALPRNVSRVRFDPVLTGNKLLYISDIRINNQELSYEENNIEIINGKKCLTNQYPYITFPFRDRYLKITLKIQKLTSSEIEDFIHQRNNYVNSNEQLKMQIDNLNNQLTQILNSKGWKILNKIRKIKNSHMK